jgi:hypothetical protein
LRARRNLSVLATFSCSNDTAAAYTGKVNEKRCVMLISKDENEDLYYTIFKDEKRDIDELIYKDAESRVSEK